MLKNFQDVLQNDIESRQIILDRIVENIFSKKEKQNMSFVLKGKKNVNDFALVLKSAYSTDLVDFFLEEIQNHTMSDDYSWSTDILFIFEENSSNMIIEMKGMLLHTQLLNIHDYALIYDLIDCLTE